MAAALPSTNPCCSSPCSGLSVTVIYPVPPSDGCCNLAGHGSPEGLYTGQRQGQFYTDLDTGTKWSFIGTVGTAIGWA